MEHQILPWLDRAPTWDATGDGLRQVQGEAREAPRDGLVEKAEQKEDHSEKWSYMWEDGFFLGDDG